MSGSLLKRWERTGKRALTRFAPSLLPRTRGRTPQLRDMRKLLVFRMDQRIGNGILLVPLLRAVRSSVPDVELHLLVHHPVAELLRETGPGLADRIWPYDQAALLRPPWRFAALFERLRREHFDLVLSSHNPDGFSVSQAVMGRWMRPGCLAGFDSRVARRYYDVAVTSTAGKHYADAAVDLWRRFDPEARTVFGGLVTPEPVRSEARAAWPHPPGGILFWLGATPGKELPPETVEELAASLRDRTRLPVRFAAGPADADLIRIYPEAIRRETLIWRRSLVHTAGLFSLFAGIVSPDTGPLHLAAALDRPLLGVFRTTSSAQYGYRDGKLRFSFRCDSPADERRESLSGFVRAALAEADTLVRL